MHDQTPNQAAEKWSYPQPVSDVLMAFPAIEPGDSLLPDPSEIPSDYPEKAAWLKFQRDWFFNDEFRPLLTREGVDPEIAYRHLYCIQRTFGIRHEHKEAAVAWLASLWFSGFAPDDDA